MSTIQSVRGLLMIAIVMMSSIGIAQTPLSGIKICLDPGHGGHDSDDRQTDLGIGTYYYESDANWEAVGYLDSLLTKLGASVKNTKTTNDPDSPDRQPSLSDRVAVANSFGADYFQSFHTNGSNNKSVNTTIVIYAGATDGNPDDPETLIMADIMDDELFAYMRTTSKSARADIPLTGYTNGLGVLNNLNMTGTLSECSFHSNLNEGRRLMNSHYRKAAAWGIVKSLLKFYKKPELTVGELGGIIRDTHGVTLNGIEVKLNPGTANEKLYTGDQYLNGFYFFDWLPAGEYEVEFGKLGYDPIRKTVSIQSGQYTQIDVALTEIGGAPSVPQLTSLINPNQGTGVRATWLPNSETTLLGYRLYYATNDAMDNWVLAANESTLTADQTSIEIASDQDFIVIPDVDVFHFKLTAIAQSGAESAAGNVISRSSNTTGDRMLIVDGFDRRNGSFTDQYHAFSTDYFKAIRDSKLAEIGTATNEAVVNGAVDLLDYDLIIWYLGDESTANETFSDVEQTLVEAYLTTGGTLLVSGSEIAWDLDNKGTDSDKAFYHDYLKAEYVADGAVEYSPATGVAESGFEGLQIEFGIAYPEDFPDDIAPINGAESILDYAVAGKTGGIGYKGTFGTGDVAGGVVNISFPLESAEFGDQKIMMKRVMEYLEVGGYFPIPPDQPVLLSVLNNGTGVSASWAESTESALIGYRLYYATDDDLTAWALVADESTLDRTTHALALESQSMYKDVPSGSVTHYKLTAISEGGFESESSDVYSCTTGSSTVSALIIDGFDRYGGSGSYGSPQHAFAVSYAKGLLASGDVSVSTVANEKLIDESFLLSQYEMVFWFVGDESSGGTTFSTNEQIKAQTYVEGGGRLFVSGAEIGWDLVAKGDDVDKLFYKNYLKAAFVGDGGAARAPAKGIVGTDFEGVEIQFGVVYAEDFPDEIAAVGGASNILEYTTSGKYGGVAYTGVFGESTLAGGLVHLSFPLEGASTADINVQLSKVVAYFGVLVDTAPIVQNDAAVTINGKVIIDVLANDWDVNGDMDSQTLEIASDASSGITSIVDGKIVYQAQANFQGNDTFEYRVFDLAGNSSGVALVTVAVDSSNNILNVPVSMEQAYFQIYPNPAFDQVTIAWGIAPLKIELLNLQGQVIKIIEGIDLQDNGDSVLDLSSLESGLYLVRVVMQDSNHVARLVKR